MWAKWIESKTVRGLRRVQFSLGVRMCLEVILVWSVMAAQLCAQVMKYICISIENFSHNWKCKLYSAPLFSLKLHASGALGTFFFLVIFILKGKLPPRQLENIFFLKKQLCWTWVNLLTSVMEEWSPYALKAVKGLKEAWVHMCWNEFCHYHGKHSLQSRTLHIVSILPREAVWRWWCSFVHYVLK